jgi:hypothetical protein
MTRSPRTLRRRVASVAAFVALLLALGARPHEAVAQPQYGWAVGPRGGVDLVIDEFSVGVHGLLPFARLGPTVTAAAYPNIDLFAFGDATRVRFDLDLAFPFRFESLPLVPYAGVGFGLVYETEDFREDTFYDLNLLGGIAFQTGVLVEPFVEAEASLFGTDVVGIYLGLNIYPMFRPGQRDPEALNPADLPQEDDL